MIIERRVGGLATVMYVGVVCFPHVNLVVRMIRQNGAQDCNEGFSRHS